MQIHPIQNEEDHAAALKLIEALMSAELNSSAGAELDDLAKDHRGQCRRGRNGGPSC